jgi:hypothetical protein
MTGTQFGGYATFADSTFAGIAPFVGTNVNSLIAGSSVFFSSLTTAANNYSSNGTLTFTDVLSPYLTCTVYSMGGAGYSNGVVTFLTSGDFGNGGLIQCVDLSNNTLIQVVPNTSYSAPQTFTLSTIGTTGVYFSYTRLGVAKFPALVDASVGGVKLPTSCSGLASKTLYNNAGTPAICP